MQKTEFFFAGGGVHIDDLGPRDVAGHEVRSELYARCPEIQCGRERFHQQGFPEPRHSDQEAVPPRKECRENLVDDLFLPEDDLAHLMSELLSGLGQLSDSRLLGLGSNFNIFLS